MANFTLHLNFESFCIYVRDQCVRWPLVISFICSVEWIINKWLVAWCGRRYHWFDWNRFISPVHCPSFQMLKAEIADESNINTSNECNVNCDCQSTTSQSALLLFHSITHYKAEARFHYLLIIIVNREVQPNLKKKIFFVGAAACASVSIFVATMLVSQFLKPL